VIGRTQASLNSSIYLSNPPISVYSSVGLSSTSMALTLESYSAGNFSRTRKLSLFTPTNSPGFNSSGSTSPIIGKKMVYLVEVFTTTHFPLIYESRSKVPPSSYSYSSGSTSRISTIFETR
jgi:hypothetical protein